MHKIKTLDDLSREVERHADRMEDDYAPWSKMDYHGEGTLSWETQQSLFSGGAQLEATLESWGYQQLAERLDAPSPTWLQEADRCPPDLEQQIIDRLIKERAEQGDKRLLLRLRKRTGPQQHPEHHIRAVLSDQYSVYNHDTFVSMVAEALESVGAGIEIGRAQVGDDLRVHLALSDYEFDLGDEDGGGLKPALYLSNSEVGRGKVRVTAAVWRAVCANGLIYGWDADWAQAVTHRGHTTAAMKVIVRDMVAMALRMSREAAERFVESATVEINSVEQLLNQWMASGVTHLSTERAAVMAHASKREYGRSELTLFDAVQGLTYAAQETDSGEEQEAMERTAGKLLRVYLAWA
jgi:hypothetical protein